MPSPRSERSTPAPILILLALACVSATGLRAEEIAVYVRAYICRDGHRKCTKTAKQAFAPADVVVEAVVPRHSANRRLRLSLYCPELAELNVEPSEYQLEGAAARTLFRLELREVTYPCAYVAAALVDSQTGTRGTATTGPLTVLSPHE